VNLHFGKKSSGLSNKLVLACFLVSGLLFTNMVQGKGSLHGDGLAVITQGELPPQGRDTYEKILQGGPFSYEKDGVVFGNRERILPSQKRGYYREYTVKTPGSRDRGARRIVCGGKPTTPDACYYTADHYSSFRKIAP
jgi:ribonuclease T1